MRKGYTIVELPGKFGDLTPSINYIEGRPELIEPPILCKDEFKLVVDALRDAWQGWFSNHPSYYDPIKEQTIYYTYEPDVSPSSVGAYSATYVEAENGWYSTNLPKPYFKEYNTTNYYDLEETDEVRAYLNQYNLLTTQVNAAIQKLGGIHTYPTSIRNKAYRLVQVYSAPITTYLLDIKTTRPDVSYKPYTLPANTAYEDFTTAKTSIVQGILTAEYGTRVANLIYSQMMFSMTDNNPSSKIGNYGYGREL